MKSITILGACASAFALTACATSYSVTPTDTGAAKVTYDQGRSTTDLEQTKGAVKITPLGTTEGGRLKFGVAVFNKSGEAVNIGTENFTASVAAEPVAIYTYAQLEKKAKTAANVALFVTALGSAGAGYSTSSTTMTTPRGGTYRATTTHYNPYAAQLAQERTANDMAAIRGQLDDTLARLGQDLLQTTTVKPGEAFGGQIILAKSKARGPHTVDIVAHWQGEDYPFHFNIAQVQ